MKYTIKKLYKKLEIDTRSELLRKSTEFNRIFPKDVFENGVYDMRNILIYKL